MDSELREDSHISVPLVSFQGLWAETSLTSFQWPLEGFDLGFPHAALPVLAEWVAPLVPQLCWGWLMPRLTALPCWWLQSPCIPRVLDPPWKSVLLTLGDRELPAYGWLLSCLNSVKSSGKNKIRLIQKCCQQEAHDLAPQRAVILHYGMCWLIVDGQSHL